MDLAPGKFYRVTLAAAHISADKGVSLAGPVSGKYGVEVVAAMGVAPNVATVIVRARKGSLPIRVGDTIDLNLPGLKTLSEKAAITAVEETDVTLGSGSSKSILTLFGAGALLVTVAFLVKRIQATVSEAP
jgi:hypothetical protein